MIVAIGAVMLLSVLGVGLTQVTTNEYQAVMHERSATKAYFVAEAGMEKAVKELNASSVYAGTGGPVSFGGGEYVITVSAGPTATRKVVTATGYFPSQAAPESTRVIRSLSFIDLDDVPFTYGMQSGAGGIYVQGSARVTGDLYSNGLISVTSSRTPAVIGNATAVTSITAGAGKISGTRTAPAPVRTLPSFNWAWWETKAAAGGTLASFSMSNGTQSLGPKVITGNFSLTGGTLTITGPVWVKGSVTISGNCLIKLDPAFGEYGTLIFAGISGSTTAGQITCGATANYQGTPSGGYLMFISRRVNTGTNGVSLSGAGNAFTNTAFYAPNTRVYLTGAGGSVTLIGWRTIITGSAGITYNSNLANAKFVAAPGGWGVEDGSWRESPP